MRIKGNLAAIRLTYQPGGQFVHNDQDLRINPLHAGEQGARTVIGGEGPGAVHIHRGVPKGGACRIHRSANRIGRRPVADHARGSIHIAVESRSALFEVRRLRLRIHVTAHWIFHTVSLNPLYLP